MSLCEDKRILLWVLNAGSIIVTSHALVNICFRLIAPGCTRLKTLHAFCMKPLPRAYKIQGFSVTKSAAHVNTERSNSCHVLTNTNSTMLSAGYKQMKPRHMHPGCWMFPRVTSLAFGIGTNSKAQHMTAHGQDDQEWQTPAQNRHIWLRHFRDRFTTATSTAAAIPEQRRISDQTVRNRLREAGIRARRPVKAVV